MTAVSRTCTILPKTGASNQIALFSIKTFTVRGKILEGENFGELMALKSLARKNLANLLAAY